MSDFLLIIPAGWEEFQGLTDNINTGAVPVAELALQLEQQAWDYVDGMIQAGNVDVGGRLVTNARLIYTESGYRFWIMLA